MVSSVYPSVYPRNWTAGENKQRRGLQPVFRFSPSHQTSKPLILNGLKGFFNSGTSLAPWFGTPNKYTVTTLDSVQVLQTRSGLTRAIYGLYLAAKQ